MCRSRAIAPVLAFGLFLGLPSRAQGLELGAGFVDQPVPTGIRLSGPSFRAAWDLAGTGGLRLQAEGGVQRTQGDGLRHDAWLLGVQGSWRARGDEAHALLGVELRVDRPGGGVPEDTRTRPWLRAGLGFRGILVPLWPWPTAARVRGTPRWVPYTRVVAGWKLGSTDGIPTREIGVELGLRINLD